MNQITLADCIKQVESSNNPLAMRFEPSVYASQAYVDQPKIKLYATNGYISGETASMIASTSWGAYQIMGYNLYDLGYVGTLADFIISPTRQSQYLIKFFQSRIPNVNPLTLFNQISQTELFNVGQVYNGDGQAYSAALNNAFNELN